MRTLFLWRVSRPAGIPRPIARCLLAALPRSEEGAEPERGKRETHTRSSIRPRDRLLLSFFLIYPYLCYYLIKIMPTNRFPALVYPYHLGFEGFGTRESGLSQLSSCCVIAVLQQPPRFLSKRRLLISQGAFSECRVGFEMNAERLLSCRTGRKASLVVVT